MYKLSKLLKAIKDFFGFGSVKSQEKKIEAGCTNQNNMADFLEK